MTLSNDEVIQAVREYLQRRGVPPVALGAINLNVDHFTARVVAEVRDIGADHFTEGPFR